MLFSNPSFFLLVIITFFLHYLPVLRTYQIYTLIVSSLFFYAYNNPTLLILLIVSMGINILTSYYVVYGCVQRRKMMATLGVVMNLSILAFFKYSPLISKTLLSEQSSLGTYLASIPLPIGISFFTFQGISLMIDTFRNKEFSENANIIPVSLFEHAKRIMLFIAFFPQLIAGPIVKAQDFLPQINTKYFKNIQWEQAFKYLVLGYFLKMVVADNLKDFTFWIAFPYYLSNSSINLIVMLFGYSYQIFADFAGYSLIALGLSKLFGYDLMINFNFPYISSSFKEFWKRWHISLSSFLMEYLYFPLGGNKKGRIRTYINLMITMFLGGLWHGAGWSYAVWGIFHGMALAAERFFTEVIKTKETVVSIFFKRIMVFIFVTFAWLLFKLPDFNHVLGYIHALTTNYSFEYDWRICSNIVLYALPVLMYHCIYLLKETRYFYVIQKKEYVFYAIMLFLIIFNSGSAGSFIYFQF